MLMQPVNIIVEGVDSANTKGIALALSESPCLNDEVGYRRFSTVISAKWGNYDYFPWSKKLVDFDPIMESQVMKNYGVWISLIELQRNYNWILDRFHISAQQYQTQHNQHQCEFNWLEERLKTLGFHVVLVTQNAETMEQMIKHQEMNKNDEVEKATLAQDLLRSITSKSMLPNLTLDISKMNTPEILEYIIEWYENSRSHMVVKNLHLNKIFLPSCS